MITPELLRRIMPQAGDRADVFAAPLEVARARWVGDDPLAVAHWLAQLAHESGQLRYVREIASGAAYEGRRDLGNTEPGDGVRFRGRGLIQLTGRANYTRYQEASGLLVVAHPELLEQPEHAADVSGWFWHWKALGALVRSKDPVLAITKIINGGTNGLEDRRQFFARAHEALLSKPQPAAETPPAPITESTPVWTAPEPPRQPDDLYGPDGPRGESMPIPAVVGAVLPSIISAIPDLIKIFGGKGQPVAERNLQAAEKVVDVVIKATGAVNAQDAAERLAKDPAARDAAQAAVREQWFSLIAEAGGGGIDGARRANLASAEVPLRRQPAFWISMALLPLVYLLVGDMLWGDGWTAEQRTQMATAILGVVAMIGAFFLGSSWSSQRKDQQRQP